eukprot:scaffold107266_cov17-Tisochrysis_lutea.AAC.1
MKRASSEEHTSACQQQRARGAIKWAEKTDDFPFSTGFITVVIAWTLVLRRENSTEAAFYAFPPLVLITVFINIFFVLYK